MVTVAYLFRTVIKLCRRGRGLKTPTKPFSTNLHGLVVRITPGPTDEGSVSFQTDIHGSQTHGQGTYGIPCIPAEAVILNTRIVISTKLRYLSLHTGQARADSRGS